MLVVSLEASQPLVTNILVLFAIHNGAQATSSTRFCQTYHSACYGPTAIRIIVISSIDDTAPAVVEQLYMQTSTRYHYSQNLDQLFGEHGPLASVMDRATRSKY